MNASICRIVPRGPWGGRPVLVAGLLVVTGCNSVPPEERPGVWGSLDLEAVHPEGFAFLSAVREISGGLVMVADPTGQVLVRVDLGSGRADTLGNRGEGPQEYEGPDEVLPLPGDSTLLVDMGNGRLVVVDPDGVFRRWIPTTRSVQDGGIEVVTPEAVDGAGGFYRLGSLPARSGAADSLPVVRADGGVGTDVTVAWIRRPPRPPYARGAKQRILVDGDQWGVGPDGQVAVARHRELSVDWYLPDGRVVEGVGVAVEPRQVTDAVRAAEVTTMLQRAVVTYSEEDGAGVRTYRSRRGVPPGSGLGPDDFEWPETLPLLEPGGTLVTPWGDAWVTLKLTPGDSTTVQVFHPDGSWAGALTLPTGSRLVGFGTAGDGGRRAYVARTDDLGLVWLERYRVKGTEE